MLATSRAASWKGMAVKKKKKKQIYPAEQKSYTNCNCKFLQTSQKHIIRQTVQNHKLIQTSMIIF